MSSTMYIYEDDATIQEESASLDSRRRFEDHVAARIAEHTRYGGDGGALLIVDLDGMDAGDDLGRGACEAIRTAVRDVVIASKRESDIAGWLGGDQYGVLLPQTPASGAEICAKRIVARIRALEVPFAGRTFTAGAHVGIALFPEHGKTAQAVFGAANGALHGAKRAGPNQVRVQPYHVPVNDRRAAWNHDEPRRKHVLVVEDDHISRKLLRIYIEDLGCRVIEASDGLAAFEICLSTGAPIELIVTDQILPGMTGLKLIESLRQKNPGLPAILMSGHTRDELDLPDSVRFIAKPLASEVLESMVRGILFEAPPSK